MRALEQIANDLQSEGHWVQTNEESSLNMARRSRELQIEFTHAVASRIEDLEQLIEKHSSLIAKLFKTLEEEEEMVRTMRNALRKDNEQTQQDAG